MSWYAILSGLRKCWHSLSPMPATTGGSPLDKHPEVLSLPTASLCSQITLDEPPGNLPSKAFECAGKGWSNIRPRPEPSVAGTPPNSPRHYPGGVEKAARKGHALAVEELNEKLARIALARALRDRIRSLIHRLLCRPPPDDTSDACDRPLDDPASFLLFEETEKWHKRDPDIDGETDNDSYTSVEDEIERCSDINGGLEDDIDSVENLCQPLLETLYRFSSDHEREELMQAILVDQLVTKAPIDPRRDLEGLCWPGIQGYTRKLAGRIGKELALEVDGVSTRNILDTALDQYQTWDHPFRSIEKPRILQQGLDQVKNALGECEQRYLGILSWLYLLRLQAQLDVVPEFHSFPAYSRDVQRELARVFQDYTVTTTADCVILDPELLMAAALRHRALINARQRFGHSIDAKVSHDYLNLHARRPDLRIRWLIGETERLLGSHAPSSLGDTERMEQCRNALKLKPFTLLRARYPDVKAEFEHEQAIWILQHEPNFQTDFVAWRHDRGVYLYYCTLVLASYGFEPPRGLDIELDYLLALILKEMEQRKMVKLCLMGHCQANSWLCENGPCLVC